jgi:hypothetical protein
LKNACPIFPFLTIATFLICQTAFLGYTIINKIKMIWKRRMSELLSHLGKDTFPEAMIREFVDWCVWEQARPSLVVILTQTGLEGDASKIEEVTDYESLSVACSNAGKNAHEARQRTGPLGLSTAEATAFLAQRLAKAAQDEHLDAEEVAFFTMQVCGWRGFAESKFADNTRKADTEVEARQAQEAKLQSLWQNYGKAQSDS